MDIMEVIHRLLAQVPDQVIDIIIEKRIRSVIKNLRIDII